MFHILRKIAEDLPDTVGQPKPPDHEERRRDDLHDRPPVLLRHQRNLPQQQGHHSQRRPINSSSDNTNHNSEARDHHHHNQAVVYHICNNSSTHANTNANKPGSFLISLSSSIEWQIIFFSFTNSLIKLFILTFFVSTKWPVEIKTKLFTSPLQSSDRGGNRMYPFLIIHKLTGRYFFFESIQWHYLKKLSVLG